MVSKCVKTCHNIGPKWYPIQPIIVLNVFLNGPQLIPQLFQIGAQHVPKMVPALFQELFLNDAR